MNFIEPVLAAIELLITQADRYSGLFPSVCDRETGDMLENLPLPIQGQRNGDRSFPGSNLMHDHPVLNIMYALSETELQPGLKDAADQYLARFAEHCTDTPTGLFPWGEHSFWDLEQDRVGDAYLNRTPDQEYHPIHDHLRNAPVWLWDRLYSFNAEAVVNYGRGLKWHWSDEAHSEYIRHASIPGRQSMGGGKRSCDFPRHSGHYIHDLSYVFSKTKDSDIREQIILFLDYWWEKRSSENLLKSESRSDNPEAAEKHQVYSVTQTLSLAVSLLDSALLLQTSAPDTADIMQVRAEAYLDGVMSVPHDSVHGLFVSAVDMKTGAPKSTMVGWGSRYGANHPAAGAALLILSAWRHTGQKRLLRFAQGAGNLYCGLPFKDEGTIPVKDPGLALGLLADLYDAESDEKWLKGAEELAEAVVPVYFDKPLPRVANCADWYESQQVPGYLFHGLARVELMKRLGKDCPLPADYSSR